MRRKRDQRLKTQLDQKIEGGRSPLYVFMLKNYQDLSLKLAGSNPAWTAVAAVMADRGVRGANGAPPTAGSVRWMWRLIQREKAAAAERIALAQEPQRPQPNRAPRKMLPLPAPQAAPPPVRAPLAPAPLAQTASDRLGEPTPAVSPEVQAKLDKLRAQFAKADRYLGLPIPGKNS